MDCHGFSEIHPVVLQIPARKVGKNNFKYHFHKNARSEENQEQVPSY